VNWIPLYTAMVGAAAAVMGLLFIAAQLSAEKLPAEVRHGWRSVASCTFYLYLTGFFLPLWFLIPSFNPHARAMITLIVALIGVTRTIRASVPIWHGVLKVGGDRWWQMLWYSLGPLILYILIVHEAAKAYMGQWRDSTDQNLSILLIALFSLALKNSWSLFVEAAFRAKEAETKSN
jgi:hypothetical protein